ncbi:methyltransferase [Dechloromonas sp. HYN0024]|uniref:methyltransferase n=1 Tax=Dechloromonas sp. HYN0024 TaxID=2231055 RepID=UPI001F072D67|nr:methyltransferase [Dechloromonas sp. HYN0024]
MNIAERQLALDAALLAFHHLWHEQPFREYRPSWCQRWPGLYEQLMALPEGEIAHFNDDSGAALVLLARHLPTVSRLVPLIALPALTGTALPERDVHWAWEIPGRKRQQIEAFAMAAGRGNQPVLDWCGGKGHLGRLLALSGGMPVHTLEIDATLCEAGESLASRAGIRQQFVVADALATADWPQAGQHAVALHACGELHRRLIREGTDKGVGRFDVAPCCYYRGVADYYQPLSSGLKLPLTRDDTRLAVTETVTASPRETRRRDRAIAWKLGFDAYRRAVTGDAYRNFKPVPEAWVRAAFADFLGRMAQREGLPPPSIQVAAEFEAAGWQRRDEVMRLSIVRHAFRRAIEVWLALDLAGFMAGRGYQVALGSFCDRQLTPRNLLISARLA